MMMMISRPKCILVSFVGRQEAVQNTMMVRYNGFGERLISFVKLFSDAGVVFFLLFLLKRKIPNSRSMPYRSHLYTCFITSRAGFMTQQLREAQ